MNSKTIAALDNSKREWPQTFGKGATPDSIREAEVNLNVEFSEDYKEFLLRYSAGIVGGIAIFGLEMPEFMAGYLVTDATKKFRPTCEQNDLEKSLIISLDGSGNPIIYNLESMAVIHFNLETAELTTVAPDFESYLDLLLSESDLGF